VEVAKSVAASQISSLERDIEELSGRITRSKGDPFPSLLHHLLCLSPSPPSPPSAETERTGRELKSSQALLEKTRVAMEEERRSYEQTMKKFEDRLKELNVAKEDAAMRVKTVQEMNTELRLTIDKLRSQEDHSKGLAEEKERYKEKEIEKLRSALRELQREHVERVSLCERLEREYGDYKEGKERQLLDDQKRRDDELEMLKQRCQEAEQSVKVCPPSSLLSLLVLGHGFDRKWN
jgi:myosin heavy subunit